MSDSSNRSGAIIVGIAIGWILFAIAYPLSWKPSTTVLSRVEDSERAFMLKLPSDPPLASVVREGSKLTIAVEKRQGDSASGATTTAPITVATGPLPEMHDLVAGVRVVGMECDEKTDGRLCYAIVAVPTAAIERVMQAPRLWLWLERQY